MATAGRNLAKAGAALQRRLLVDAPALCTAPGQPVLPLRIGIRAQLVELAKDGRRLQVRKILKNYAGRTSYLRALAEEGAQRHDLTGTAIEPVSEEHRADAAKRLAVRLEWKRRKREERAA